MGVETIMDAWNSAAGVFERGGGDAMGLLLGPAEALCPIYTLCTCIYKRSRIPGIWYRPHSFSVLVHPVAKTYSVSYKWALSSRNVTAYIWVQIYRLECGRISCGACVQRIRHAVRLSPCELSRHGTHHLPSHYTGAPAISTLTWRKNVSGF